MKRHPPKIRKLLKNSSCNCSNVLFEGLISLADLNFSQSRTRVPASYTVSQVRVYLAWTLQGPREKVTVRSDNDGPNSAITEARTPRGFRIRL